LVLGNFPEIDFDVSLANCATPKTATQNSSSRFRVTPQFSLEIHLFSERPY